MHRKRSIQQILLLLKMNTLQTRRHTRAWIATSIQHMSSVMMFRVIQQRLNTRLHEAPRTRVQGLFLTPHDVLGVRIAVEVVFELLPGERVQLLNACDSGVLDTLALAVFDQSGVNLAGAEDDALDVFGSIDGFAVFGFGDNPVEVGVAGEFFDGGAAHGVAQKGFGEEDHER